MNLIAALNDCIWSLSFCSGNKQKCSARLLSRIKIRFHIHYLPLFKPWHLWIDAQEELSELIGDIKFGIRSLRPKISELGKELHISSSPGQLLDRMRKNHCEVLKMRLNELLTVIFINNCDLKLKRNVALVESWSISDNSISLGI